MTNNEEAVGPIAIGGVGGSGTRVIAMFVQALGVNLGQRMNPAMDNLWFTLLFKRRSWSRNFPNQASLEDAIATFSRAMTGRTLDASDVRRILVSMFEYTLRGHNQKGSGRGLSGVSVGRSMLQSGMASNRLWGWKEPNTHIFLAALTRAIPNLHYIHIIRDGIVMANSGNWDQAALWGPRFGLPPTGSRPSPSHMLKYWVRANEAVIETGAELLDDRFILVRFEDLIARPDDVLSGLAAKLRLTMTPEAFGVIGKVRQSPRRRPTKLALGSGVDADTIQRLERLGYPLPS